MDTVTSGCFAKTTGPSTSLRFGRDDKGRVVTSRKNRDLDGRVTNGYFARSAYPTLRLVAEQKGRSSLHQLFDKGSRYVRGNAVTLFG